MIVAACPSGAAGAVYYVGARDVAKTAKGAVPDQWTRKLFLPVLIGSLTPLAAAPAVTGTNWEWLLVPAVFGILFTIAVAIAFRGDTDFFDLQKRRSRGVAILGLTPWNTWIRVGLAVIALSGTLTLVITHLRPPAQTTAAAPTGASATHAAV
jgi:ABC-type sugar transport system permease subunit